MVFQALPPCVLHKMPENHWFDPFHYFFFCLCDLEICQMTLKIWEPKSVGVFNHLMKYQGNRWWNMLADRQTDRRTVCRSEEWHTLHTITPNKWPKHKRKNLRKIRNGAWAYIVLLGCQTNALPSYVYQENVIFKWSKEKGDCFFAFKDVFNLNVHLFHYKGSSCLRLLFRFKEFCTKRPQEGFRIKWYTAALSATLST